MDRYYYSAGKRQRLEPVEDRVAIDTRGAEAVRLGVAVGALTALSKLPGGMIIVDKAAIGDDVYAELARAGVSQPVYRSGAALVVLMPEVRVETDAGQHAAALEAFKASDVEADVMDDTPERLSFRPKSGNSEDALDLANFIYEHAHPAASSVRMLQVVPKPSVTR